MTDASTTESASASTTGDSLAGGGEVSVDAQLTPHGAATSAVPASTSPPASQAAAAVDDSTLCVVCLDGRKDTVFLPCKHLAVCRTCAVAISGGGRCPLCRADVESTLTVFL